ncbi:MAG: glycosyltransferase family 87 protein [Hyphomicrobium sp.]
MTRTLLTAVSVLIVGGYLMLLVTLTGPAQGWPGLGERQQVTTDYVAIWTGGRLALEGRPLDAYDWDRHRDAAEELLGKDPAGLLPWPYPPTFLAIAALFAFLPYGLSMMLWVAATSAAYAVAAARIMGTAAGALWLSVPIALAFNAHVGQNGALSAALLGLGLISLNSRPVLAGICIGLLSYKPHLGLLIPIALAFSGHWRTIAAAAATAIGLALVSVVAFGWETWAAFLPGLAKVSAQTAAMSAPEKLQTLFGLSRCLGLGITTAYALQSVLALMAALVVGLVWRDPRIGFDLKAALLSVASLLVSPYLFVYDLTILTLAQAFLYRASAPDGLDTIEIAGLVAANIAILFFSAAGIPLGFVACLIVLALVLRRVLAVSDLAFTTLDAAIRRLKLGSASNPQPSAVPSVKTGALAP